MAEHWRKYGKMSVAALLVLAVVMIAGSYVVSCFLPVGQVTYSLPVQVRVIATSSAPLPPIFVVTHVKTPDSVKGVYYTSWAAGSERFRKQMFDLVDTTEINAVVIDVKDYSGRISFKVEDPMLIAASSSEDRIPDIKQFIGRLHDKGVYVIGRISSFQDSYLVKGHPEWAVKTKAGAVWKDYRGVKWLDPGAQPVWDYLVAIGKEAYADGFDELNFDYIRYPSDGNLKDISYSWSAGRSRTEVMKDFYMYLRAEFASTSVPISADLFGLTTSALDDMGIGQMLTDALPNFDYVSPMVYPSHFGAGYEGFAKPATKPYEVIKFSMDSAVTKALNASSSPMKLRPWLQAFDLGAIYTPAMVRAQIKATYDAGLNSWLLWDATSVYDKNDLLGKEATSTAGN